MIFTQYLLTSNTKFKFYILKKTVQLYKYVYWYLFVQVLELFSNRVHVLNINQDDFYDENFLRK